MLENLLDFNLLRISPKFVIDQTIFLPFLSKTASHYLLIFYNSSKAERQEVKIIDNSVVVHELELATNCDL